LRYYILFDIDAATIKAVTDSFKSINGFECLGVFEPNHNQISSILKFIPELVIINLDIFWDSYQQLIKRLNKYFGVTPNYIGITRCARRGLTAFKNGFKDVIDEPTDLKKIEQVLLSYKKTRLANKFYCISYYYDFQYLAIDDILFLKADGYTTEFFMTDGRCLTNFKTLKHSHLQLPYNFQRIHKSYVINSIHVRRIHIGKGEIHLLNVKHPLPVSKSYIRNIDIIKRLLSRMPL